MHNPDLDKLLSGSIDMHLHIGPDEMDARLFGLEAAKQAAEVGMKAIVLKNHSYPTSPVATVVKDLVPEVEVFGGICLDYEIGGLNIDALEKHARIGVKVAWMPTFSSKNSRAKMRALGLRLKGEGFSILTDKGKLVPEIDPILDIIKQHDIVLASGHMSPAEIFAMVDAASKKKIEKIVITHPSDGEFMETTLTVEELRQLAGMGAYIEQTTVTLLPTEFCHNPQKRVEIIKAIGVEHCIMSTDLGQYWNPYPAEGFRFFMAILVRNGLTPKDIEVMAKKNPARLLGLE
jgi:imidazolonepropionase-like amidohydrolase